MITFVNMFTVKTGQQAAAFAGIQQIYSEVFKFQAGFISATLLKVMMVIPLPLSLSGKQQKTQRSQ